MFAAHALAPLDWAVIAGYLAGIIALGSGSGAGRNPRVTISRRPRSTVVGVALSIVATETSALTFIGVPAMLFAEGGNLGFIQIVFGYAIGRLILAVVMVPYYFKNEIYSPFALIGNAFGQGAHKTAAGLFLIAGTWPPACECSSRVSLAADAGWDVTSAILLFVGLSAGLHRHRRAQGRGVDRCRPVCAIRGWRVVRIILHPHPHRWRLGGGD